MSTKTVYYEEDSFVVFKRNTKRNLTVWNRKKPFTDQETGEKNHGHVRRLKTAKEAIIAVKYHKLIRDSNPRFLELCAKLSVDEHYSEKCRQLAETKRSKPKKHYNRKPKHYLKQY